MTTEEAATYHLEPGFIYVSITGDIIRAVIGSAVAVCIWDNKKEIGGACLFNYSKVPKNENRTAKYGDVAIKHLIDLLLKRGSSTTNLKVQIYGGGSLTKDRLKRPSKNIKIARQILKNREIEIISEDIGGSMGRKILFNTKSGHVAVLKVHETRNEDWFD
jgi:chemotaxis protein CheD